MAERERGRKHTVEEKGEPDDKKAASFLKLDHALWPLSSDLISTVA